MLVYPSRFFYRYGCSHVPKSQNRLIFKKPVVDDYCFSLFFVMYNKRSRSVLKATARLFNHSNLRASVWAFILEFIQFTPLISNLKKALHFAADNNLLNHCKEKHQHFLPRFLFINFRIVFYFFCANNHGRNCGSAKAGSQLLWLALGKSVNFTEAFAACKAVTVT